MLALFRSEPTAKPAALIGLSPMMIHFSDEAHFHLHGMVNTQNYRYWASSNPNWYREAPLHSPRLTVFALIGYAGIAGPFFFDGNVNSNNYLQMLQEKVFSKLQTWRAYTRENSTFIFMQDGAPPHFANKVKDWLTATVKGRWMGRGSPTLPWPPYSPDLNPLDFFLWGYIKSKVYTTEMTSLDELKGRIEAAFASLPSDMVRRSIEAYVTRLQYCIRVNGRSVEQAYDDWQIPYEGEVEGGGDEDVCEEVDQGGRCEHMEVEVEEEDESAESEDSNGSVYAPSGGSDNN